MDEWETMDDMEEDDDFEGDNGLEEDEWVCRWLTRFSYFFIVFFKFAGFK